MRVSPTNSRPVTPIQSAAVHQPVVKTHLPFYHCCTTTGYVPQTRAPSFFQRIRSFFARLRYRSNYLLDYLKYKLGGTEHFTGLDVAKDPNALPELLREGNTYLLEKYLDHPASIEAKLVCAHFRTQNKKTQTKNARFFAHHKLCFCATDKYQQTPLIIATKENDWPLCQAILDSVKKPSTDWLNKKDSNQKTAMMYAQENGNQKIIDLLRAKGAQCLAVNNHAPNTQPSTPSFSTFIDAVKNGNLNTVNADIQNLRVSLDTQDEDGMNALMYAASYGNHKMVALLIDNGADLTLRNHENKHALQLARANEHHDIAQLILKSMGQDI